MKNNKTKPGEVIQAIKWNSDFIGIYQMSFGSNFNHLDNLNAQKRQHHTKNSSLKHFEQDSSHSFPLLHDSIPVTTVTAYLSATIRATTG